MRTIWRVFIHSWKNLFRNAWIGLATVFVFTLALLSVNILLGLQAIVDRAINVLEQKVDITVNFKDTTPESVVTQARFYLASLPQVASVNVVSAQEVLVAFKQRHANHPSVLAGLNEVGTNPFGAQLILKANRTEDYPFLIQAVQNPQYVQFIQSQSYDDHRETIIRIQTVSGQIRLGGSILIAVFALFGALVAFNTIRVAIYTQREEIAIMRLVGASSTFIRAPFMLEAIWLALLAFLIAGSATYIAALKLEPFLAQSLFQGLEPGLLSFFQAQTPTIVLFEGGGLIVLSTVISWLAAGKFIKR